MVVKIFHLFVEFLLDLCGFESDSCGFENSVNHKGHWGRRKGIKDNGDHTYGTENGKCWTLIVQNL